MRVLSFLQQRTRRFKFQPAVFSTQSRVLYYCQGTRVGRRQRQREGQIAMKQRMVIKVQMGSSKSRSKAMGLVATTHGVESVAVEGREMNHLVVVGDGVDAVGLTSSLRRKMGSAEIVGVEVLGPGAGAAAKTMTATKPPPAATSATVAAASTQQQQQQRWQQPGYYDYSSSYYSRPAAAAAHPAQGYGRYYYSASSSRPAAVHPYYDDGQYRYGEGEGCRHHSSHPDSTCAIM